MGQEAEHQRVAGADPLDAVLGLAGDLGDGVAGVVGQLRTLQVRPEVLDRVELGRVGGQPLGGQPAVLGIQVGAPPPPSPQQLTTDESKKVKEG